MTSRTLLVIVAAVAVAGVSTLLYFKLRKPTVTVWLANGLDVPVEASVAGTRVDVESHRHASVTVKARELWVVVTRQDGTEVDREKLTPKQRHIVFNPLGAAPLAILGQMYSPHGITSYEPARAQDFLHTRVLEPQGVDYFFEAPLQVAPGKSPGPVEKRILRLTGTWEGSVRELAERRRQAEATQLLDAIAALEPESQVVAALREELARKTAPAPKPKPAQDWTTSSADQQAMLVQERTGDNTCRVRCERKDAGAVWTTDACIARAEDLRFVASDCSRTLVFRQLTQREEPWRDSKVVFVYANDKLVESHTAGEYVTGEGPPNIAGHAHAWIHVGPRLSGDARSVEVETSGNTLHQFPLEQAR